MEPPGIRDIKRIELFDKYGPLIPDEYKSKWKYYSEDPGIEIRKRVTSDKKISKELRQNVSKGNGGGGDQDKDKARHDNTMHSTTTSAADFDYQLKKDEKSNEDGDASASISTGIDFL